VFNYLHNFIVVIIVLVLFAPPFSSAQLLLLPGYLIIIATAVFTSLLLGIIGARFWDFSHTITVLMAPMFLMTPVLWMPDMLGPQRAMIANLNPFTHFIALVREPLLGRVPGLESYAVAGMVLLILVPLSLYMLSLYRKRIAYWI